MNAYYDLSCKPATFDIVGFLTASKTLGCDHIVFDVSKGFQAKKFPAQVGKAMYENVLIPVAEEWGFTWSEGKEGDVTPPYMLGDLYKKELKLKEFPLWSGPPTITIRNSIRNEHRNSSKDWYQFADEIGAIVIEDAYVKPISIKERLTFYRNAKVNFFCSNGPAALCIFSNLPYISFSPDSAKGTWGEFPEGSQVPWAKGIQKIVWKNDTLENLRAVRP